MTGLGRQIIYQVAVDDSGEFKHCRQPMCQLVMKLAMVPTDVIVVAVLGTVVYRYVSRWQPGTDANRYTNCCFATMSIIHRLWSRGYNTLIILFG